MNNTLPVYSGSVDHLRQGFRSLEHETSSNHPLQSNRNIWMSKVDMVRRTYGSHLAMKLATEKEVFSHLRRLPGLESSNIALETVLGTDESMEFADYLNGIILLYILCTLSKIKTCSFIILLNLNRSLYTSRYSQVFHTYYNGS